MQYKKLIISKIVEEVSGFKTFEFEPGHGIEYKAGQYLTLTDEGENETIRRSYSIISTPVLNEPLAIGVKRIPNGAFSRKLTDNAKKGDIIYTLGAGGFFCLPDHILFYKQIYFFAAGSGITPVISLIKTCLHLHTHLNIVLIYSNASPEKTVFHQQLILLKERFGNRFQLQFLFSNEINLHRARLNRELLIDLVNNYTTAKKEESVFYICGPEAYMRMCTYTLQEEGVSKENIRRENFSLEKLLPPKLLPPYQETCQVKIHQSGVEYSFNVHYPDTILKAAKSNSIVLPYSCETGRCGSCAAKILQGKVWLSYNEVLTEKELEDGLTLTCVGHPVGDVELRV